MGTDEEIGQTDLGTRDRGCQGQREVWGHSGEKRTAREGAGRRGKVGGGPELGYKATSCCWRLAPVSASLEEAAAPNPPPTPALG